MKKILTLIIAAGLLCGCVDNNVPESGLPEKTTSVTSSSTTESVTEPATEAASEEKTEPSSYPEIMELDLAEPDKDDLLNKRKTIFFTDNGYYYYSEIGGRDSANYVLSYDSGDGNCMPIENGEDCIWRFTDGDTIYGVQHYTHSGDSLMSKICKYKDGAITPIAEIGYLSAFYFTDEYIYYYDNEKTICRMDYNGENIEEIVKLDSIEEFAVHDDKIWYKYTIKENNRFISKTAVYNIETGESVDLMVNFIHYCDFRFNGRYMYCIDSAYRLLRTNTDDYTVEVVCENADCFDFCGKYIIYACNSSDNDSDGKLYRFSNDENTEIFNAKELLNQEYYYDIDTIQCENGQIFIDISSGPFYSCVTELDIDGNLIKKYYETKLWN